MRHMDDRRGRSRKTFNDEIQYDILTEYSGRRINKKFTAHCTDISNSGLGMMSDVSLEKGRIMKISLPVSAPDIVIPAFGEVAWSSRHGDHFWTGVRFLQ